MGGSEGGWEVAGQSAVAAGERGGRADQGTDSRTGAPCRRRPLCAGPTAERGAGGDRAEPGT